MTLNDAARTLAQVLRAENDLLAAGDYDGAARLLGEKQRATAACHAALPDGEADPHWARLLGELAGQNRTLLVQAMEVQSRILEMVARAARLASPGATTYGSRGHARSSIGAMAMALRA